MCSVRKKGKKKKDKRDISVLQISFGGIILTH